MKSVAKASGRGLALLLSPCRGRTMWGALLGAAIGVLICVTGGLLGWWIGAGGAALTLVWTLDWQAAAARGAMLGLLIGWLATSRAQLWRVWLFGTVLLLVWEWKNQFFRFVFWPNIFDLRVALHLLFNTLLICAATYAGLRLQTRNSVQLQPTVAPEPHPTESYPETRPTAKAAADSARVEA